MQGTVPIKINNNRLEKWRGEEQSQQQLFPPKAPNIKLKEDTSKKYFVRSVSSEPLAHQISKEELRINLLHGKSQPKMPDNKITQPQFPRISPTSNFSNPNSAPTQVIAAGINPFMKNQGQNLQQKPNLSINPQQPNQQSNNIFTRQNNNFPVAINPINPFSSIQKNNQFHQSNQINQVTTNSFFQSRQMLGGMQGLGKSGPGLVRQTSFGDVAESQFKQSGNIDGQQQQGQFKEQQQGGMVGQITQITGFQVPGQVAHTPSFGNLRQNPPVLNSSFSQSSQPQGIFGAQTSTQPQSLFPTTQNQPFNVIQPQQQPQPQLQSQPQPLPTTLDMNIKQLLESKPNLWNILALDPQFKNGFNEHGRIYVKSVLQRIIDENIISGQSLNKIIIEIYKQMYGPDNFQKLLQNKKSQLKSFDQDKMVKTTEMIAKELHDKNIRSVFPDDISTLGDDFYRSFKRIPTKFRDNRITTIEEDIEGSKFRLQRKFLKVRKPQKPLQIKYKFIQLKKPSTEKGKQYSTEYTQQSLQKIAENISEIRKQKRKQIMPLEQDLPNVEGFTTVPSMQTIRTFTKHELLSVPKVTISNEWGTIRFRTPISLLRKILKECIIINQKSVEIIDDEWKVRQAEITFKKFADFSSLEEDEQNELEEKIINWCEKEKFELIKVDRQRGQVVIGV